MYFKNVPIEFNFWDEFEFFELTINMRQRDDPNFAAMLDRIRVGCPIISDIEQLESRTLIDNGVHSKIENAAEKYIELKKTQPNMLCLFALVEDTDNFNILISNRLNIETVDIPCNDTIPGPNSKQKKKRKE